MCFFRPLANSWPILLMIEPIKPLGEAQNDWTFKEGRETAPLNFCGLFRGILM